MTIQTIIISLTNKKELSEESPFLINVANIIPEGVIIPSA